jgi:cytochrome c biogenesis protein CcdA
MLHIYFSLFITGIITGAGPCLLSCGPILLSYISATASSAKQGLFGWLVFSASRFLSTVLLGFTAAFAGTELLRRFYWEAPGYIIWLLTGLFIIFLGITVFIAKGFGFGLCNVFRLFLKKGDTANTVILGIFMGLLPCIPLIGVLSYITMTARHYVDGIFMSAAFSLGTIISPLAFGSMAAGALPGIIFSNKPKRILLWRRLCGLILIFFGVNILVKTLTEFFHRT